MMSPAAMISVAGFEELQNSAREQLGAAPAATPPPSAAPIAAGPSPMRVASIVVVEVAIAAVVLLALSRRCAAFPQARPARVRSA